MKDRNFYNQESARYSGRRYPGSAKTYTQFFFKRRLALTKKFVKGIVRQAPEPLALLEVGCADGIVISEIGKEFPSAFTKLTGIDTAPGMVEEARRKNVLPNAEFFVRDAYAGGPVDVVIETGVINYARFEDEIAFAQKKLKPGGSYIFSIAGTGSLLNRLKPEGDFSDFRPYAEYGRLAGNAFDVLAVRGCGFFIPFLWRVPALARLVQAAVDPVAGIFLPGLCHEKVYWVQKK